MWLPCDFRFVQFSINLEIDLEQSAFFPPVKIFPRRGIDFIVLFNITGFTFGGWLPFHRCTLAQIHVQTRIQPILSQPSFRFRWKPFLSGCF